MLTRIGSLFNQIVDFCTHPKIQPPERLMRRDALNDIVRRVQGEINPKGKNAKGKGGKGRGKKGKGAKVSLAYLGDIPVESDKSNEQGSLDSFIDDTETGSGTKDVIDNGRRRGEESDDSDNDEDSDDISSEGGISSGKIFQEVRFLRSVPANPERRAQAAEPKTPSCEKAVAKRAEEIDPDQFVPLIPNSGTSS